MWVFGRREIGEGRREIREWRREIERSLCVCMFGRREIEDLCVSDLCVYVCVGSDVNLWSSLCECVCGRIEGRREIENDRERERLKSSLCECVCGRREGRREIEKDRERERLRSCLRACVVCVRCVICVCMVVICVCVCVWVPPVMRTHDSLNILDKFYNYLDNFMQPWMVVSFKTVCRYCFKRWSIRAIVEYQKSLFDYFISLTPFKVIPDPDKFTNLYLYSYNLYNNKKICDNFNMFNVIYYFISLTIFKAIPDPFQSLNTKRSIFKVSLQTYIYIIVIYTTTNKFVWTRMLIFLSN
ncbi:unnamed protein product [Malus baccata var. baccata]